ncbi:site-specific integrase [Paraburkholderia sp.]|uniref:integrase n=1 Tax=Paraburkholderia sp. TaxID=1926495 RepID=UPI0025D4FC12|nr:site-specific integrase [Paraburkholderia sp.]
MGTIQKRAAGTYQAKIRRRGYPPQSRTFTTRADAQRWITEQEAAISRGVFVDTSTAREMLLQQALDRYAAEVTPTKKGADVEALRLRAMARDPVARYSLATLTPAVIAAWRDRRLVAVSGSTVNRELNLLHHVLEVARKDWSVALPENPASMVRRPTSAPARSRRLSPEEQTTLLDACRAARVRWLAPLVELALLTGMRQGEVRSLHWENVDLDQRTLVLDAAATKTTRTRGVPLSTQACTVLESIPGDRTGPIFPGVTRNAVKLAFDRARRRAGLADFRFHDTRHEATTRFFEMGLSDSEVMSITGHQTTAMLKRYTHLRATDLARKLDRLSSTQDRVPAPPPDTTRS